MAAKFLEVAVILTAIDKMSGIINSATGKSAAGFEALANAKERAAKAKGDAVSLGAGAYVAISTLGKLSNAYGNLQEAQIALKNVEMKPGGIIDEKEYAKSKQFAHDLSSAYRGSQQSYIEMELAMHKNKLTTDDILGGAGDAVAKLADIFGVAPETAGLFAARLKNDLHVPVAQMGEMVDLANRLSNMGMGQNGEETVHNMTEIYSQLGISASLLGMSGAQAAKDVGLLAGMWVSKGMSAEKAGTNIRKILDAVRSTDKVEKMNIELAKLGKHVSFFDKAGHFKGIGEMNAQFGTLKNLTSSQLESVFKPFGARNGIAADMAQYIAKYSNEFGEYSKRAGGLASANQVEKSVQSGQNYQYDKMSTNWENLMAALGELNSPGVVGGMKSLGDLANNLTDFVTDHPKFASVAIDIADIAASLLTLATVVTASKYVFLTLWPSTVISWIAGTAAWATVATLASDAVWGLISAVTALGGGALALAGGIAAMAAGPVAFALWEANYGSASKMLASAETEEKNYVPISPDSLAKWNSGPRTYLEPMKKNPALDSAINIHNTIHIHGDIKKPQVDTILHKIKGTVTEALDNHLHAVKRTSFAH